MWNSMYQYRSHAFRSMRFDACEDGSSPFDFFEKFLFYNDFDAGMSEFVKIYDSRGFYMFAKPYRTRYMLRRDIGVRSEATHKNYGRPLLDELSVSFENENLAHSYTSIISHSYSSPEECTFTCNGNPYIWTRTPLYSDTGVLVPVLCDVREERIDLRYQYGRQIPWLEYLWNEPSKEQMKCVLARLGVDDYYGLIECWKLLDSYSCFLSWNCERYKRWFLERYADTFPPDATNDAIDKRIGEIYEELSHLVKVCLSFYKLGLSFYYVDPSFPGFNSLSSFVRKLRDYMRPGHIPTHRAPLKRRTKGDRVRRRI